MYSLVVIDDEMLIRMAISGFVQKNLPDLEVVGSFSNGLDALDYIRKNPVNIVITDIRMPEMDGLELARHISEQYPGIILIIISGYAEFEYAQKAILYGCSTYLLKPLDFLELEESLINSKTKLDNLYQNADCQEEHISLFFTDLISGTLNNFNELQERFQALSLPGTLSHYKGYLLTITLDSKDSLSQWKYGRENLSTTLLNSIRMALAEYQCYSLFRKSNRYFFIVLSFQKEPDFSPEELKVILYDLLNFSCSIKKHTTFFNIEELYDSFNMVKDNEDGMDTPVPTEPLKINDNEDVTIQHAMSYIQSHYAEDLTREDVAAAVYLSPSYFSYFFKQKTGMNFIDYLTTVRMQKAAELLTTQMKVSEISKKIGYQSRNRFYINFRQYSGYTPTEYRKQILKREETFE